ncbi:UNVERIFIED_CONTAM: hypothetical protein PYX00_000713 [Menopon gallinae]|uniref:Uncharacterized protein n=1 Tax=Menopon gallinae TaxID=328185 RepID=A0AAW2IBF6_9NEOP
MIEEPPEGYYAFIESPSAEPPKIRRPPYVQSDVECPVKGKYGPNLQKTLSLCGDLNKGYIPKNPMKQNIMGSPYPFELIKNKTLQFFSKALPILKADETLPKVAKYKYVISKRLRVRRDVEDAPANVSSTTPGTTRRVGRKFCDNNDGVLCLLYKAFQGESILSNHGFHDRRDDANNDGPEYRRGETTLSAVPRENLPPTPCPAKVEYATPVFARNYQGVWRYVVQIPYEGYFTQTIEVTRCLTSRCAYMDGGCMSSPRWTSILVAEIYYPDAYLPGRTKTQSSNWSNQSNRSPDFQNYQQYLQKRAGLSSGDDADSKKPTHCDGVDEIGCFQVRLYYDWFLVPGSCKCWRPDYFSRYMRRKVTSPEL